MHGKHGPGFMAGLGGNKKDRFDAESPCASATGCSGSAPSHQTTRTSEVQNAALTTQPKFRSQVTTWRLFLEETDMKTAPPASRAGIKRNLGRDI